MRPPQPLPERTSSVNNPHPAPMEHKSFDVLLIEDDEDDAFIVRRLLKKAPAITCELTWESSYEAGLEALRTCSFDVAVVDYRLGTRTGLELIEAANALDCHIPVILLTGQGSPEIDLQAMQAGAADYLSKSNLNAELLERALRYARERARSEEAIRRQAALLNEAQDAICTYDLDGNVTYWNEGARRMTGYAQDEVSELCTPDCLYGADGEAVERAWEAVREEGEWTGELKQTTKDGDTLVLKSRWTLVRDPHGVPEAVLVLNTDITERKQLERQALRSQRMESIGRLVGGIAHDLGNLLVPIQLGVSVLRERYPDDERAERSLRMIEKSAERGSDMVERVLSFARGVEGERQPLDLADVAGEVEALVEESFPTHITFETDLPEHLPPVRGDATQIQQVLVNLSVNARDAMPDGGHLVLEARSVLLEESDLRFLPDGATTGHFVHVCVEDTGDGIPPEALDKIFEPFFSTKSSDDGTGLGLSTVYSIVKSHEGFVDVESEEGRGTCFDIFLPAAEETDASGDAADALPTDGRATDGLPTDGAAATELVQDGPNEGVLVVDDEAFVRESAADVLEDCGYRPFTAASIEEALRLFDEHPIKAILCDMALDGASGLEAVRAFKSRRPDVPVVVCSGRADSQGQRAREAGAEHFLTKPFGSEALRKVIDAALLPQCETKRETA